MQPILTIGHSNRSLEDFLHLLQAHGVELLADVRKLPGSRAYPHFNSDQLAASLETAGIGYRHLPGLGGRRKAAADSPNDAWRNKSFRAYADYMSTHEFAQQLQELQRLADQQTVAMMCSEALPWKCHRSLIADALVVAGTPVGHIMSATKVDPHQLRDWALVEGTRITYPAAKDQRTLFD